MARQEQLSFWVPPGAVRVREPELLLSQKFFFFRNTVPALLAPWPIFSLTVFHAPSVKVGKVYRYPELVLTV